MSHTSTLHNLEEEKKNDFVDKENSITLKRKIGVPLELVMDDDDDDGDNDEGKPGRLSS
jgi:hypothetical protein